MTSNNAARLSEESRNHILKKNVFPFPVFAKNDESERKAAAHSFIVLCERLAESGIPKQKKHLPENRFEKIDKLKKALSEVRDLGPDVIYEIDKALPSSVKVHWTQDNEGRPKAIRTHAGELLEAIETAAESIIQAEPKKGQRKRGSKEEEERKQIIYWLSYYWKLCVGKNPPKSENSYFDDCVTVILKDLFPNIQTNEKGYKKILAAIESE